MTATVPGRPVMRYYGGKWLLAPWILAHLPPHRIYVEPFGGAASVLLQKPRSYAEVYNDLDGEVVNVFQVLRNQRSGARLRRAMALTPYARAEFDGAYEPAKNPVEQARRTLIRSFMGFGSNSVAAKRGRTGFRANAFRQGTVPAMDWRHWPESIHLYIERLRGVSIECQPAAQVIERHDSVDTCFYIDPPYPHSTRALLNAYDPKGYYRHELSDDDHRALAEQLRRVKGMVVLSGYPCDLYDRELFADWHRIERHALADGARARREVLWLNQRAAAAVPRQQVMTA